jgi:hypothetical protein
MPDNEKDDKEIQIRNTIALFHFSAVLYPVMRIRDGYPGSEFFPYRVPDPGSKRPRIRIRNTEFVFLSSRKYEPGCYSRIWILVFNPSGIQEVKNALDPAVSLYQCTLLVF